MSTEPNEIINTTDIALDQYDAGDGDFETLAEAAQMNATHEPDKGISFHVQMQGYTQSAMDELIVEAAARLIVGRRADNTVAKQIEELCIKQVTDKANAALHAVTNEILDQPLIPNFGEKQPVTMREFIGLTGREYLSERVGNDGKPVTDSWGRSSSQSRIEWLVNNAMQRQFKSEIEKATNAAIAEVQKAIRDQHAAFLVVEKARLREALNKVTSP